METGKIYFELIDEKFESLTEFLSFLLNNFHF